MEEKSYFIEIVKRVYLIFEGKCQFLIYSGANANAKSFFACCWRTNIKQLSYHKFLLDRQIINWTENNAPSDLNFGRVLTYSFFFLVNGTLLTKHPLIGPGFEISWSSMDPTSINFVKAQPNNGVQLVLNSRPLSMMVELCFTCRLIFC